MMGHPDAGFDSRGVGTICTVGAGGQEPLNKPVNPGQDGNRFKPGCAVTLLVSPPLLDSSIPCTLCYSQSPVLSEAIVGVKLCLQKERYVCAAPSTVTFWFKAEAPGCYFNTK